MTANTIREALTTAMMHSAAPMVLSDPSLPDCPMIVVNQAFCDLSGYEAHEIVGRNCRFLQGPKTRADTRARIRANIDAGHGCIEWIVNYRRNTSLFWNLLFISPIHDEAGKLLYFFGNQLDITYGLPVWLDEIRFGSAYVIPALEQEFHALLREVTTAERVQGLESILAAARRLAEITVSLEPGTLDRIAAGRA